MKSRFFSFAIVSGVLLMSTMSFAQGQKKPKMTPAEIMAALKPGQWVQMEGIVQRDFTVLTKDIKSLTGDFLETDWSITAPVRDVDPAKKEFKVLLLPIKTQQDTEYENKINANAFASFNDLKAGMLVEADGSYLKDGTFLTHEIEDVSAELAAEPGLENQVEAIGKVQKLDASKRTVTVMGITFHVVGETELKSAVK